MGNQQVRLPENAKLIPTTLNYYITEESELYSVFNEVVRKLKPIVDTSTYYRVKLIMPVVGQKSFLLHRLVAMTYLDNPNNLEEVNHKDGNKLNNHVSNLEWVSRSDNLKHAYRMNLRSSSGENNPRALLEELDVINIYNRLLAGESNKSLADEYNIGTTTVLSIKSKDSWDYLLKDLPDIAINIKSKTLDETLVREICCRFSEGVSAQDILKEFEGLITKHQVHDIKRKKCFIAISKDYIW